MRRIRSLALVMLALLCLSACTGKESGAKAAARIAEKYAGALLEAKAEITADYGERVYVFTAEYSGGADGGRITVLSPANIAGVSAIIEGGGAKLEFEGVELNTGKLDGEGTAPMSALTYLMQAWSAGEYESCSYETRGETKSIKLKTPFGKSACQITWFDESTLLPLRSEIIADGRAVLIFEFKAVSVSE